MCQWFSYSNTIMEYCGINPQGYHGINLGSFVPKSSFKVRQLAASSSRRDAADREDYCFIRQHQDRRFPGCSLPEINVKRLFNKPKKKHSRSHTFGGASSERLKFPAIIPTATEINTDSDAPRREAQQVGEDRCDVKERRVVRNGEPWWKWSRRNHDHELEKRHHTHTKQSLPCIENLAAKSDGKTGPKQKKKHVQHNLRQKLPPLVGYRDGNGNLLFSEAKNSMNARTLGNRYMYDSRNVFLNRRYYYSYSRDGIRPCRQETKISNACLFDLSNLQPTNPDYASHQEAMITSMHNNLQQVSGMLPAHGLHIKNNSNLGAKVKQSLNRDHERAAKKQRKQPVVINIDSSYAKSDLQEEDDEGVSTTAAPVSQHPKGLNHNHLRMLAILQELINILNSTEYVPGSDYSSKEATSVSEIPTLSQINLGDFFQKPESFLKQYDRFKKFNSSIQHPHFDDMSAEQNESDHKESHKNVKNPSFRESGLTQLLAVHRLQTSNKNLSDMDLDRIAAKLTAQTFDSESINKSKSSSKSDGSQVDAGQNFNKTGEQAEGDQGQYPGLSRLLAIQQLQVLNENLSNTEVPDNSTKFDMSALTHSDHGMEIQCHHFTQKSLSGKCDVQSQLMCVDLNDQYLQFSNNGVKKQISRHPTNRKMVHNVSKQLLVEPAEKRQNLRPDLEISGEKLRHLYDLGLLNSDQELTQLAVKAEECVTVSREQLTRIQDIYDHASIGDSTIQNPKADPDAMVLVMEAEGICVDGNLPEIEISMDDGNSYYSGENRDLFPEGIPPYTHSGIDYDDSFGVTEGLQVKTNAEQEDKDSSPHGPGSGLRFNRDLSWDLESEFARVQAMDLQQRLQMEQMQKERKVLDSVKRDLQQFQETLQSSSSGTRSERPMRQRESLLPPPPPPKKKTKSMQLKISKKNEQRIKASANASTSESDTVENTDVSKLEMGDDGNSEQQQPEELGDQLPDKQLEPNSVNTAALEEESMGEGDAINDQQNVSVDHSEIASDTYPDMIEHDNTYPAFPDVIEEESDGYLSDSDVDADAHSDTEAYQLSQTGLLDKMELLPKSALKEENQVVTNNSAKSGGISTRAVYDSVKSGLTGSNQEHRTSTAQRTNTRGGNRPVSKQASMDSWSHIDTSGLGSSTLSASRGMRGSALPGSQRGKRISSSEFKDSNVIGEDMGPLRGSVSQPRTVQQYDVDSRTSSGQRSRLPTRERLRKSSQAQITVADPVQVLAHRKSELAKQQLMEARKKAALLEQERERQRQEKIMRQAEFEDRMSTVFKGEEDEIRRQRKLKAEAEELEKRRQALVQQMKKQEAEREAQEKARHSAMLESLRREAERRHLQVMHEKGAIEDYQDRISTFNEWDYAYIDHYMGDKYSQQARKIDQAKKLKQQQLLHQRMMEAFEYKRRELLEKLKAAQKELMMELELEKGQLDHFVKISRAFVFTYFKRVPDQTFMVPQELLM